MAPALLNTLNGAVALVTGARGGIGYAICRALCEMGASVVATGRGEPADGLAFETWLPHDVTSAEDWSRVVYEVQTRFGRLDCLINNAGVSLVERIADTTVSQWRRVFSVNVESNLLALQRSLPLLRESGRERPGGSSVVMVSSTAGMRGVAFNAAYCASKGALTMLTKAAAREFAMLNYPIRVNSVHPGPANTRMMSSILSRYVEMGCSASVQEQQEAFVRAIPLGRIASPEEVAGSVAFLCSPAAGFMTGSEMIIDGGAIS